MFKFRIYFVMALLGILALLAFGCAKIEPAVEPEPAGLAVSSAAGAVEAAIDYLHEQVGEDAPAEGIVWQEEDITTPGLVGGSYRQFTSGEWVVKVSYPVVALENTVYQVTVTSNESGWHWQGSVSADGSVTEGSAFMQMTEAESRKIAEEFVKNSPTFIFDGIEDTLELVETLYPDIEYSWGFVFRFESRQAGYGDRDGQVLAQVITPHEVSVSVEHLEVISALMDNKWDMINQRLAGIDVEITVGAPVVADLLANPVYDTEVRVQGEVGLLGELFCPCFELTSGGQTVQVWYGLMVENDGTERPELSVAEISNGDTVIVTGELKAEGGTHYSKGDFWASEITVTSPVGTGL